MHKATDYAALRSRGETGITQSGSKKTNTANVQTDLTKEKETIPSGSERTARHLAKRFGREPEKGRRNEICKNFDSVVCIVMLMSLCVAGGAAQVRYNNTVAPGTSKVNPTTKKTGGQYATCMHNKTTPAGDNYFSICLHECKQKE